MHDTAREPVVDLIWLSESTAPPAWPMGEAHCVRPLPSEIAGFMSRALPQTEAAACLFWDSALGTPDQERVKEALSRPGHLWHAGLRLGMGGLPRILDTVAGGWMLQCDPAA